MLVEKDSLIAHSHWHCTSSTQIPFTFYWSPLRLAFYWSLLRPARYWRCSVELDFTLLFLIANLLPFECATCSVGALTLPISVIACS